MKLYHKFRNSCLDTAPLGLVTGKSESDSAYTPAGARIVAWLVDSDIHFCQIEGFGSTVFVVDPSAPPGDCIHPLASKMADFIGLLCACPNAALIAQSYQWSRALFEEKADAIKLDYKTRSVLRALENTYQPTKIFDIYGYMVQMSREFDYASLPLKPEYFEWCPIRPGTPKWEVGFTTAFADYCEKGKAGQELAVKRSFLWNGETWFVPAIYLCDSGIVVDSVLEVATADVETYMKKWGSRPAESLSIEEAMVRDLDDPLKLEAAGSLSVNGKPAPLRHRSVLVWNPRTENPWQARRTLEHYGLDPEKGYLLRREQFLRRGKNPPIRTMELTLSAAPVDVPGQRFVAPKAGESLQFDHPATGKTHTMTIIAQTREALDPNFLSNHPCCYTRLTFSLEPGVSRELFSVVDCDPGDAHFGNDEPVGGKVPSAGHCALSSLRYTPAEQITWRMVFRQKLRKDASVSLLP